MKINMPASHRMEIEYNKSLIRKKQKTRPIFLCHIRIIFIMIIIVIIIIVLTYDYVFVVMRQENIYHDVTF